MDEQELKEEAERLGWRVEYLKQHLAKERRIEKVFEKLKNEKNSDGEDNLLKLIINANKLLEKHQSLKNHKMVNIEFLF